MWVRGWGKFTVINVLFGYVGLGILVNKYRLHIIKEKEMYIMWNYRIVHDHFSHDDNHVHLNKLWQHTQTKFKIQINKLSLLSKHTFNARRLANSVDQEHACDASNGLTIIKQHLKKISSGLNLDGVWSLLIWKTH